MTISESEIEGQGKSISEIDQLVYVLDHLMQVEITENALKQAMKSENSSRLCLSAICKRNGHRECPKCWVRTVYPLGDGRRKCASCRFKFHDFSLRWINEVRISPRIWLLFLYNFVQMIPVSSIGKTIGISNGATFKAALVVRKAIALKDFDLRKAKRSQGCPTNGPSLLSTADSIFGLQTDGKSVSISMFKRGSIPATLQSTRIRSVEFSKSHGDFSSVIYWRSKHKPRVPRKADFDRILQPGCERDFWLFAEEGLRKNFGIDPRFRFLYLKELEFRFNQRAENIYATLLPAICNFVPPPEYGFFRLRFRRHQLAWRRYRCGAGWPLRFERKNAFSPKTVHQTIN